MRIRKNANITPTLLSQQLGGSGNDNCEVMQTHVCQLNQSPWDVISSYEYHQFEVEDSYFNGNGSSSLGDSIGAVESVTSMMEDDEEKMKVDDDDENNNYEKFKSKKGKKSRHYSNDHNSTAMPSTIQNRRARARTTKKTGQRTASNPSEFYYYSGFGPLWGKRRGGDNKAEATNASNGIAGDTMSVLTRVDEEFDYVEEEMEEEEEEEDDSSKKRMRKPVKARSLKSLM